MRRVRSLRDFYRYMKLWLFGIKMPTEWEDAMIDLNEALDKREEDDDVSD